MKIKQTKQTTKMTYLTRNTAQLRSQYKQKLSRVNMTT